MILLLLLSVGGRGDEFSVCCQIFDPIAAELILTSDRVDQRSVIIKMVLNALSCCKVVRQAVTGVNFLDNWLTVLERVLGYVPQIGLAASLDDLVRIGAD